ncbi:MAG: hypothetical protein VB081_09325, partial [Christensenella sp.]|uniref:hypothetical protein n=1 Tax=Christensenella sp. TaxID=1935934 RepID=UPI002B1FA378
MAAIFNILHIPVNIISIGVANIAASIYFWYDVLKNKRRQQYGLHWLDLVFAVLLFLVVCSCMRDQFGSRLELFYQTTDPARHMIFAMDIVNTQSVSGMFFAQFNNAMFIEMVTPFLSSAFYSYIPFIIADGCMLYLSGMMIYALMRKLCKNMFLRVVAIVLALVYVLGYPFNNMIFGFTYLGVGVTVVGLILFAAEGYIRGDLKRHVSVALLSIGLLELMLSYLLFVPVVMLAVFICLTVYLVKKKQFIKKKTLLEYGLIFLVPIVLGLLYSYSGIFNAPATDTTVGSAIAREGPMYRSLYANFVIFMPFAAYAVLKLFHKKKISPVAVMFIILIAFIGIMLVFGLKGKVASYYYYKNYFLLWLLYFYLAFYGIYYLAQKSMRFLCSYLGVWLLLALISFTNLEARIKSINPLYSPELRTNQFFDVYFNNMNWTANGDPLGDERMDLYHYIYDNKGDGYVPAIASDNDKSWFEALTNQRIPDDQDDLYGSGQDALVPKILADDKAEYIL